MTIERKTLNSNTTLSKLTLNAAKSPIRCKSITSHGIRKISVVKTRWSFRREIFISADCSIKHMSVKASSHSHVEQICIKKGQSIQSDVSNVRQLLDLNPSDTNQYVQNIIIASYIFI
jgi:hypothetical protein